MPTWHYKNKTIRVRSTGGTSRQLPVTYFKIFTENYYTNEIIVMICNMSALVHTYTHINTH